jgi:hypothetical protein
MIVEIHGLEVFGRHGVGEAERRDGQPFLFDVTLDLAEPAEDSLDATVDYRSVRDGRVGNGACAKARRRVGGMDRGYRFARAVVTLTSYVAFPTLRARRTSAK